MIANRWRSGTTSQNSSRRLPARSVDWSDRPVMLPPGRDRLATKPLPTGSFATTNTIGMTDVACFTARSAVPDVTMTSTFSWTNSAAISTNRSSRPSAQRYSTAMVRPSIQPKSRNRCHARGHKVDHQLELDRLNHRQVARLGALKDAAGIGPDLTMHVRKTRAVTHQSASIDILTHREGGGNRMARRQERELDPPAIEEAVRGDEQCVGALPRERCESGLDLAAGASVEDLDFQREAARGRLDIAQQGFAAC